MMNRHNWRDDEDTSVPHSSSNSEALAKEGLVRYEWNFSPNFSDIDMNIDEIAARQEEDQTHLQA